MFSKFSKFSNSKSIFILNSKSLLSNSLSDNSSSDKLVSSLFLDNSVWLSLNSYAKGLLNIFLRILCGSKRVFSIFSILFAKVNFILISKSSSYINRNSLIFWSFSFSSSDFGILRNFSDFEYFNLNFLIIFEDSDLEVKGEIFGIYIFFFKIVFKDQYLFNTISNFINFY